MSKRGEGSRTPGGLIRKSVYFTEDQVSDLRTLCVATGQSESTILGQAFSRYLETREVQGLTQEDLNLSTTGEGEIEWRSITGAGREESDDL